MFVATIVYEFSPTTDAKAQKLFRAEMVGRRYNEHWEGRPLPRTALWIRRTTEAGETVVELKARCEREVQSAVQAVRKFGLTIELSALWVKVMGGGTFGLAELPF